MASTRQTLKAIAAHLDETMRLPAPEHAALGPVPRSRDVGRRPLRNFGRIDIDQVMPDPDQPREQFDDEALENLAKSIREQGQLSPIRVRWSEETGKWIIVYGERRWRAAKKAGLTEIECAFQETELSPSEILQQQLIENCLREDLQPIEEARAFAALIELNGWTGKEVAQALHIHPSRVSRALSLLRLPELVQEEVNAGRISPRVGYEISRLPDARAQTALARKAAVGSMTHAQAAGLVRRRRGKPKPPSRGTKQTFITEEGWKVVVSSGKKGTYHEIEQALDYALDEVRHRLRNNIRL